MEHFVYKLYIITFLLFPLIGYIIAHYIKPLVSKPFMVGLGIVFIIHNVLFLLGYSIVGDYPDYILFSIEYLFLSTAVFLMCKIKKPITIALGSFGRIIILFGLLQGLIGVVLFPVIAQDFETDKIYNVFSNEDDYQIRRYTFGFATLADTRFTYEVYRSNPDLLIEEYIDCINIYQSKTEVNFEYIDIDIQNKESNNKKVLSLMSDNTAFYTLEFD